MSEAETKLKLETILKEMRAGFEMVSQRLDRLEGRASTIERQLEQMDVRLDEISSFAHQTRSEILALRANFKTTRIEAQEVGTGAARARSTRPDAKRRA